MSNWIQRVSRTPFLADQSGGALVETALSYTGFFFVMVGVIQFCLLVYTFGVYQEAARVGVRYAVQHGIDSSTCSGPGTGCTDSTGANVIAAVDTYAARYVTTMANTQVQAKYPDSSSAPGARVVVDITYTYVPFLQNMGFNQAFQIASQGRILY